jgi:hypothetical protein
VASGKKVFCKKEIWIYLPNFHGDLGASNIGLGGAKDLVIYRVVINLLRA